MSDEPGAVKLWNVQTAKEQAVLKGHTRGVFAVVFSPDGEFLATAGAGSFVDPQGKMSIEGVAGEVKLWKVARDAATVVPADKNDPKQLPEDGKTTGAPESLKAAKPLDQGQATKPAAQGKTPQEAGASDKTKALPKELAVDLGGGVKLDLVLIPAGEFKMGSLEFREKPQRVRITQPFYLGKYEVTQEQWESVMGDDSPSQHEGPKNPVENVSWGDCQQFLVKLNAKTDGRGGKFVLPTEAQWEYACRAGSTGKFCFGDDEKLLSEYAWYLANSGGKTHPVGGKKPNAWGLYDMHGNVSEWCPDWYEKHGAEEMTYPIGPTTGSGNVGRGGSINYDGGSFFQSAYRSDDGPGYCSGSLGLRVARVSAEAAAMTPNPHGGPEMPSDSTNKILENTGKTATKPDPKTNTEPWGRKPPKSIIKMPSSGTDKILENNGKLDLDTAHWTVPKSWVRKTPKSSVLQAEYCIPKVAGDQDDGRLTISRAGGAVEDNVARWKRQFSKKLDKESQETIAAGEIKITLVDLTGTMDDTRGMMGPIVTRPDYRMLGAIFKIPNEDGLHFIKCYGPKKTITERADEIKEFLTSLKVDK